MGSLTLKRKLFNKVIFKSFESRTIRFKGPIGTTLYNFIDPWSYFNNINSNYIMNVYTNGLNNAPITFTSDSIDWYDSNGINLMNDYVIPLDAIFQLESTSNIYALLDLGGNAEEYYQGKTSIKKQNLTKVTAINLNPDAIYVFKSATTNLLGTIFNASQFYSGNDTVQIFYQGSLDGLSDVFLANSSDWIDVVTEETANNYVIPANSIIIFSSVNANLNASVGGGAIIQRYNRGTLFIQSPPPLITNGLAFHVDPSNPSCYSGSGTSCNDLTSINGVGTLSNVTFSSSDKAFLMNSDTSRVYFNRSYTNNTNSVTFMVTVELPSGSPGFYPNIMSSDNGNFGGIFIYGIIDPTKYASCYISEDSGSNYDEIIYNIGNNFPQKRVIAATINGTVFKLYVDGILRTTSSPHGGGNVNAQAVINLGYAFDAVFTTQQNLKIYNSLIYNRPLSDSEIFSNYRYLKARHKL